MTREQFDRAIIILQKIKRLNSLLKEIEQGSSYDQEWVVYPALFNAYQLNVKQQAEIELGLLEAEFEAL